MPGGALAAAQTRSMTPALTLVGHSARSRARVGPPGSRVNVPEPCRASAYPVSLSTAYARVTVVRETPSAAVRSRSLGSRVP